MNNQEVLINTEELADVLERTKYNPATIVATAVNLVERKTKGEYSFADPTDPAIFLLEFASTLASNAVHNANSRSRELYPKLAVTQEELYHHMSSRDYIGRFAVPSTGLIRVAFDKEAVIAFAEQTENKFVRKIILPRGTFFNIDGLVFTLLYSVEIRVLPQDAIQCVYLFDDQDPIQPISSNVVEWFYMTYYQDGIPVNLLTLELPLKQVKTEYYVGSITAAIDGYVKQFQLTDEFVHCRVYSVYNEEVKEIETTHSMFVHDPNNPTAVLRLLDNNRLEIRIPHIYFTTNQLRGNIHVEVYTTKGAVDTDLEQASKIGRVKMSLDNAMKYYVRPQETRYVAPISQLQLKLIQPYGKTAGGNNSLSFDQLRDKVINQIYYAETPITLANIRNNADIAGYELVRRADVLNDRIFHITRELPKPNDESFYSGAPCAIETVYMKMSELEGTQGVIVNRNDLTEVYRMTITPDVVFRTLNNLTRIVNEDEIPNLTKLGNDLFINRINSLEYSYSPFYYCLDTTNNTFNVQAFYLDSPSVDHQLLKETNPSTLLTASVDSYEIVHEKSQYRLRIVTRGSKEYNEKDPNDLFVLLGVVPVGEMDPAWITGRFVNHLGENGVWEFLIGTNYDFDTKGNIVLNNFKMYTNDDRLVEVKLTDVFNIIIGVYDHQIEGMERTSMDDILPKYLLDIKRDIVAIVSSELTIQLGRSLDHLWRNARLVSSTEEYETYPEDVYLTYRETVYDTEANGLIRFSPEGEPIVRHRQGEFVLGSEGEKIIEFKKGDIKKADNGKPILKHPVEVAHFVDIFLIDGIYKFATNEIDTNYIKTVPETIVNLLDRDVAPLSKRLLEETSLFYSPKKTMGTVDLIVGNGESIRIVNRFPFRVDYYMNESGYYDTDLRNTIMKVTREVLNEVILARHVSVESVTTALRQKLPNEVMSIRVYPLGPNQNIQAYTIVEDDGRCSIRRKLSLQPDGTFKVNEDITIGFLNHQEKRLGE